MKFSVIDIEPGEIRIEKEIIADLMGIDPEKIPEPYNEIIQRELDETIKYTNIRGGYGISEKVHINLPEAIFFIEDIPFNAGSQVVNYLEKAEKIALFICTAGEEVTTRSRKHMSSGNMLEGYVADIIGTLLVEGVVDLIHRRLKDKCETENLNVTNRYSPGYCNWKVAEQKKVFSLLPEDFCGVRLSPSSLMIPMKSISGVIGIGRKVMFNNYVCNNCKEANCIFRDFRLRVRKNPFHLTSDF
jgi:hypothetical protein